MQVICLNTLVTCISLIAISSSEKPIQIAAVEVSPNVQVAAAAWAFVGIPITLAAGVGSLYRIELNIRLFFWYLVVSFFFGVTIPIWFMASGSICSTVVSAEVQRMGSAFVCGFTDTATFFWTMIGGLIHMYIIYIVWSASEEIAATPYPELMKYSDALRGVKLPAPPAGPYPMNKRAIPIPSNAPPQQVPVTGFNPAPNYSTINGLQQVPRFNNGPPSGSGGLIGPPVFAPGAGDPQSFIPGPGSQFNP